MCLFVPLFYFFSVQCFSLPLCLFQKSIEIPVSRTWHATLRPALANIPDAWRIYFYPKKQSITGLFTPLQSHLCRQLSKRSRDPLRHRSARTFINLSKPNPSKCTSDREWQSVSFTMLHFYEQQHLTVIVMEIEFSSELNKTHVTNIIFGSLFFS